MPFVRTTYTDALAQTPTNPFLLEGLIPAGVSGLLVAAPAWGKTSLSLQIALSVVTGSPCLGVIPTHVGHVIFVELESTAESLCRRLYARIAEVPEHDRGRYIAAIDERLHILTPDYAQPFKAHTALSEDLMDFINGLGLHEGQLLLVVVDSLAAASCGDENSVEAARQLWSQVNTVCDQTKASVLLLHHLNKSQTGPGGYRLDKLDTDAVRGSSAIAGFARFILQGVQRKPGSLWLPGFRKDEFRATLRLSKWNDGPMPEDLTIARSTASVGFWELADAGDTQVVASRGAEPKVMRLFRAACTLHHSEGSVSRSKLQAAAKAIGMSFGTGFHTLRQKGLLDAKCQLTPLGIQAGCESDDPVAP